MGVVVPPKIKHFAWQLVQGVLPNRSMLRSRNEERSRASMVLCDYDGRILKHQRLSWVGTWNSGEAEAKDLLKALRWAELEGIKRVFFETDAHDVYHAIYG
ncbi:hypothetical protein LINPERPRIM_LOCUS30199 [Linum perenne]